MKTIAPKITPFLWFNDNAGEAVKFYTSIFTNSKIHSISPMSATFSLDGVRFMALNGGPQYRFTPAISFFVGCKTRPELDALWKKLSAGGAVLMELTRYPFSERFGWLQDRFGVSWQLSLGKRAQKITPFLMFVRKQHGRAGEAIRFYASAFKDSKIINIERYGAGEVEKEGTVKQAVFRLNGREFMAMDSGADHPFTFSEAISLFVSCPTQKAIDYFWRKLSTRGSKGRCGWLKDRFGVSWQIIPPILGELLFDKDAAKSSRVREAMFKMTKLDIRKLKQAALS